jgi:membrane-bound metal-dependent hydrolase YbcI (DUF457 family)
MAELLTHVLVGYALATGLSLRYEWITPEYVTMAMVGAMVPDLNRLGILVTSETVEAVLGVPFSWTGIHTLGGSVLVVSIGALLVTPRHRSRVFLLLTLGMLSHHALDLLLVSASGYSYPVLWPLSAYHPPTPGIYLSSDRWPLAITTVIAGGVWYVRHRLRPTDDRDR